jgi:hypothetical protein
LIISSIDASLVNQGTHWIVGAHFAVQTTSLLLGDNSQAAKGKKA